MLIARTQTASTVLIWDQNNAVSALLDTFSILEANVLIVMIRTTWNVRFVQPEMISLYQLNALFALKSIG